MSTSKKLNLSIFLSIILLALFVGLERIRSSSMDDFKCASSFSTSADDKTIYGLIKYRFHLGHGEVAADFFLKEKNRNPEKISRVFDFHYSREGNEYTMISQGFYDQKYFNILKNMIPDFYLIDNSGLRLKIYKQSDSGFVFDHENISILYCAKIY